MSTAEEAARCRNGRPSGDAAYCPIYSSWPLRSQSKFDQQFSYRASLLSEDGTETGDLGAFPWTGAPHPHRDDSTTAGAPLTGDARNFNQFGPCTYRGLDWTADRSRACRSRKRHGAGIGRPYIFLYDVPWRQHPAGCHRAGRRRTEWADRGTGAECFIVLMSRPRRHRHRDHAQTRAMALTIAVGFAL